MTDAIMQTAMEVSTIVVMAMKEAENLASIVKPLQMMPRAVGPALIQLIFIWRPSDKY